MKSGTLLLIGLLWSGHIDAQQEAVASGGDAFGTGGSAAYSIGQVAYTTHVDSSGVTAQGVQHAYEVYIIDDSIVDGSITVFPNPAHDHLILEAIGHNKEKLWIHLFDENGKLFIEKPITGRQTTIDLYGLSVATYLVKVVNHQNKSLKSFKIIKYKK